MNAKVAIIGSGNIGSDLMMKVIRLSDTLRMAAMVGIDPASDGLARARRLGIATTDQGVAGLLELPEFEEIGLVFDATSAKAHVANAALLRPHGKILVDLTPAAIGLDGHTHDVVGIAAMVLPDGVPVAVTVSPDRTARVWDLRDGSQRGAPLKVGYEPHGVSCRSLADGTPIVVVHNVSEGIRRWDLRDHTVLGKVTNGDYDVFVDRMHPVVLPDGLAVALAAGREGPIKALDLTNGKTRFELRGHTDSVRAIDTTVLPDGTPVAVSVSGDRTIRIWDLQRRALRHIITGLIDVLEAVVCTSLPDGTPIAVACDYERNTTVRDLRGGSELPYRLELWGSFLSAVALPDRTLVLGLADDDSAAVHELT